MDTNNDPNVNTNENTCDNQKHTLNTRHIHVGGNPSNTNTSTSTTFRNHTAQPMVFQMRPMCNGILDFLQPNYTPLLLFYISNTFNVCNRNTSVSRLGNLIWEWNINTTCSHPIGSDKIKLKEILWTVKKEYTYVCTPKKIRSSVRDYIRLRNKNMA